jgi:UDP-glucuronate decarboxylase
MERPERPGTPINVGNPVENTIRQVADLIVELTGSAARHTRMPMPVDDPSRRCPDITLATQMLGWEPRVPLREGLTRTIAAFRTIVGAAARPAS